MSFLLKLFPLDVIIQFVVDYLASTVKNPNSAKSKSIYTALQKLDGAIQEYFAIVPRPQ